MHKYMVIPKIVFILYYSSNLSFKCVLATAWAYCAGISRRRRAAVRRAAAGETVPRHVTNVVPARTLIGRAERHTHVRGGRRKQPTFENTPLVSASEFTTLRTIMRDSIELVNG